MAITDSGGGESAFAILDDNSDHVSLEYILVGPEMRNLGIGTQLMRAVIEKYGNLEIRLEVGSIDDNNDEEADLDPQMDEDALVKYYERFGFQSVDAADRYNMIRLPDQTS